MGGRVCAIADAMAQTRAEPHPPSLAPKQNEWSPKAPPLVGGPGGQGPPGGFQGSALTFLHATCRCSGTGAESF